MGGLGALQDLTPWSPGSQSAVLICALLRDLFQGEPELLTWDMEQCWEADVLEAASLRINLLWEFADILEGTWDSAQWAWGPWNNSTLDLQDGYFIYMHILSLSFLGILFYCYLHSGTFCVTCGILIPRPRVKPVLPAVGAES